jgi:AraC-like DNA-binding protein
MKPIKMNALSESTPRTPVALEVVVSAVAGDRDITKADFTPKSENSKDRMQSKCRLVQALGCSTAFREYQRAFEDATGLPLTLRAPGSFQLAHHGSRRQNGFCALMYQSSRSCAGCLQIQQRVCEGARDVPCTMSCALGLSETAVGVRVGHDIIAYLQTGQIFFQPPTQEQTQRALKQIKKWGLSLDWGEAARRYNETPVICRSEYRATVRLLQFFADQLGATANQIVMQQRTAEPAQITCARHFIEAHYQEDLSLAVVAKAVHMSRFYFCKMFKKVTGLGFTPYVSRIRVEHAKKLLLNRNCHVSEIAQNVGFQSSGDFNRAFRRIAGESPTDARQRLPTP